MVVDEAELLRGWSKQLQPRNPCNDQRQADDSSGFAGLTIESHAQNGGAHGADAGPDRVTRPNRNRLQRERQEEEAHAHAGDGADAGPEPREALGGFQADRPPDFEQSGDDEIEPVHSVFLAVVDCCLAPMAGRVVVQPRSLRKQDPSQHPGLVSHS